MSHHPEDVVMSTTWSGLTPANVPLLPDPPANLGMRQPKHGPAQWIYDLDDALVRSGAMESNPLDRARAALLRRRMSED